MSIVELFITGVGTVIFTLLGLLYKANASRLKDHEDQIRKKADSDRLHEIEVRMQSEFGKLEARHDREMDQLAQRLGEQIRTTETNILTQIRLMISVIQGGKE